MAKAKLGQIMPRECGCVSPVIARSASDEAIQAASSVRFLDCFASARNDGYPMPRKDRAADMQSAPFSRTKRVAIVRPTRRKKAVQGAEEDAGLSGKVALI